MGPAHLSWRIAESGFDALAECSADLPKRIRIRHAEKRAEKRMTFLVTAALISRLSRIRENE